MASPVAERLFRPSSPETIERDLSSLWREVARRGPVARAVMSNLVVFRSVGREDATAHSDEAALVSEVASRHPSRVIVIEHQAGNVACAPTAADVGVITFGPEHTRYGVEHVLIRSTCDTASLPSIVRRLLRGDLPTSVWWIDELTQPSGLDAIVGAARQLVFDSARCRRLREAVRCLAPLIAARRDIADVNWRRLAAMRRAVVVAAERTRGTSWDARAVRIRYQPSREALAWLLAGWLASRLEWTAGAAPTLTEDPEHDALSVEIEDNRGLINVVMEEDRVRVSTARETHVLPLAIEAEADAVAAELRDLKHDVHLHDALSALVRYFAP